MSFSLLLQFAVVLDGSCIEIHGPAIRAQDLAQKLPAFAQLPAEKLLSVSPNAGVRRDLSVLTLRRWLEVELRNVPAAMVEPICVYRTTIQTSDQEWIEAIRSSLESEFHLPVAVNQIELLSKRIQPGPPGLPLFSKASLLFEHPSGQYVWSGRTTSASSVGSTHFTLRFKLSYQTLCLASTRKLSIGDELHSEDVAGILTPWIPSGPPCLADRSKLIGKVLRRSIDQRVVLRDFLLTEAPAIQSGDEVTVSSLAGRTRITFIAVARGKARVGEPLLVATRDGHRLLRAVATAAGEAEIRASNARKEP